MTSHFIVYITLIVFSTFLFNVQCARILAVFPYPSKSHMVVYSSLTRELVRRGHELVVVSNYPLSKPMPNYTDINIMDAMEPLHEAIFNADVYNFADFPLHLIVQSFWEEGLAVTELALLHPKVQEILKDTRGFDLVLAEAFIHEAIYAFSHHFKAPLVLISSMSGMHWTNYIVDTPVPLSYIPNPMLTYTDHMTFYERAENAIFTMLWDLGNYFFYFPKQEALKNSIFGSESPSIRDLEKSVSMILLNNHYSLNYARPLAPAMIEVGGMHVSRTNNKLPEDIQKFLDGAIEGAIFFSMGSNLRSDQMPKEKLAAFMNAFSKLPQRILWKWESEKLPGQPPNVKLGKWLPQQDILAHPNVKLFITHGGLLSAQEAAYHGVPVLGIPVYGDQMLNMRKAVIGGYGLLVAFHNVTEESVSWALHTALNDPSILKEAKRRSKLFRDQPENPLDRAVYWTEYVLRHDGAPHLRTAAKNLSWYQLYLLDVGIALIILILLPCIVIKRLCMLCLARSNTNTNKQKKS